MCVLCVYCVSLQLFSVRMVWCMRRAVPPVLLSVPALFQPLKLSVVLSHVWRDVSVLTAPYGTVSVVFAYSLYLMSVFICLIAHSIILSFFVFRLQVKVVSLCLSVRASWTDLCIPQERLLSSTVRTGQFG